MPSSLCITYVCLNSILDIIQALLEDQFPVIKTDEPAIALLKDFVSTILPAHGYHARAKILSACLDQEVRSCSLYATHSSVLETLTRAMCSLSLSLDRIRSERML